VSFWKKRPFSYFFIAQESFTELTQVKVRVSTPKTFSWPRPTEGRWRYSWQRSTYHRRRRETHLQRKPSRWKAQISLRSTWHQKHTKT